MLRLFTGRWRNRTIIRTLNAIFIFLFAALFIYGFVSLAFYIDTLFNEADRAFFCFVLSIFIPSACIMYLTVILLGPKKYTYADKRLEKIQEAIDLLLGSKTNRKSLRSFLYVFCKKFI